MCVRVGVFLVRPLAMFFGGAVFLGMDGAGRFVWIDGDALGSGGYPPLSSASSRGWEVFDQVTFKNAGKFCENVSGCYRQVEDDVFCWRAGVGFCGCVFVEQLRIKNH